MCRRLGSGASARNDPVDKKRGLESTYAPHPSAKSIPAQNTLNARGDLGHAINLENIKKSEGREAGLPQQENRRKNKGEFTQRGRDDG